MGGNKRSGGQTGVFRLKKNLSDHEVVYQLTVDMRQLPFKEPTIISLASTLPASIFLIVILLAVCPAHAAWEPDFWGGDCNCSIGSLPPVTESTAWIDDTHSYFFGVACDYGRYGNDLEANSKASHIQIRWESPDAIAKRHAEKQKTIPPHYESIHAGRSPGIRLVEYTPPSSDYVSLLYKKPAASPGSTIYYSGERSIVYKSQYYIEIDGMGYDISDAELISLMDDSESCAKAIVEKQEIRATRNAMDNTQKTPGFGFGVAVLSLTIGAAVLVARRL
jgi:hypothetical protein